MNNGKTICKQLKAIRHDIAKQNDIKLDDRECTYEGECNGTCPHCDGELQYIEQELTKRGKLGKVAAMAGMAVGLTAGGQAALAQDIPHRELRGDVPNVIYLDSCVVVGTVHNIDDGKAVAGTVVSLLRGDKVVVSALTNNDGYFELTAMAGEYQLRYLNRDYEEKIIDVVLNQDRLDMGNTELSPMRTLPPLMGIVPYDPTEHQQEEN